MSPYSFDGEKTLRMNKEWASRAAGVVLLTAMMGLLSISSISAAGYFFMVQMRKRELRDEKMIADKEAETGIFTTPRGTHEAGGWTGSRSQLAV